ncbi:MAG: HPr family phosphocarrier protein [Planctomycetota bacterium]|nr:HPr family phosphocarrier protein [Planctomycetota bacterium]
MAETSACSETVRNEAGLHARPCHALVSLALGFESSLRVSHGGREVNGKSILELMTLGVVCGGEMEFRAEGSDAEGLIASVSELLSSGFGEGYSTHGSPKVEG